MRISDKTTYGFQFMLQLALSFGGELYKLADFAQKENISEKYLESIVAKLRTAGLIEAKKGAAGGYKLAKAPGKINALDIYSAIEGSFTKFKSTSSYDLNKGVIIGFWKQFNANSERFMTSVRLSDLVDEYKENSGENMFYI